MDLEIGDLFAKYWFDFCECYMDSCSVNSAWMYSEYMVQQKRMLRLIEASTACYKQGNVDPIQIVEKYAALGGLKLFEAWGELALMLNFYGRYQGVLNAVRKSVQYVDKSCGVPTICS